MERDRAALVKSLADESALLARVLRVSRLQHGRALYYQRLSCAHKRLLDALACCTPAALEATRGPAAARAAVERALDAIPSPWHKLRHLLSQTYFMTFALACLSLLSRASSLLARVHGSLGGTGAASSARRPVLLELAPHARTEAVLDKLFADGAAEVRATPTPAPAAHTPTEHATDAATGAEDGYATDDDVGVPVSAPGTADEPVDALIFIDPLPAASAAVAHIPLAPAVAAPIASDDPVPPPAPSPSAPHLPPAPAPPAPVPPLPEPPALAPPLADPLCAPPVPSRAAPPKRVARSGHRAVRREYHRLLSLGSLVHASLARRRSSRGGGSGRRKSL
jgi:hypothetical protein